MGALSSSSLNTHHRTNCICGRLWGGGRRCVIYDILTLLCDKDHLEYVVLGGREFGYLTKNGFTSAGHHGYPLTLAQTISLAEKLPSI